MKYYLFIDETGNFEQRTKVNNNTNFVAGWVCQQPVPMQIRQIINNAVTPHNQEVEETLGKNYRLKVPDHLHFIPLHIPRLRTDADDKITFPMEKVPPLMSSIFNNLEEKTVFTFRSTGFPRYYANEQSTYIEILRATILQVLNEIELKKEDKIEILIASRRIRVLMGESGIKKSAEYERNICDNLRNEISEVFAEKSMGDRINIVMASARKEMCLAVADLFCGALRNEKNNYLESYKKKGKLKKFSIHKAFFYLSNRTIPRIRHVFSEDHTMGIMLGLEHLAMNPLNNDLKKAVDSMCKKIDAEDTRLLENELQSYLEEKLIKDPNRYENLDFTKTFIDEVEKRFTGRRIIAFTMRNRIIIGCHRGEIELVEVQKYLDLLEKHGPEIFNGMYNVAQERLETILFMVQSAAFNIFKFEDVEKYLTREIETYDKIFPLQDDDMIDETRARLEGTIGQMYAFLCDYPEGDAYHDDAELYLKMDIVHCAPHSPFWLQGMGYLTSFYFKRNDLEKTINSFMVETRSKECNTKDIFDLSKIDYLNFQQSSFSLLHRLYTCALALRQNMDIIGEETLKSQLLDEKTKIEYPTFLIMKWLGVIYALKGDIETALLLFERAVGGKEPDEFTIEVIKIPIKIMIHFCKKKLGKRSRFDLRENLDGLETRVQGISKNLERLGIKKHMEYEDIVDWYAIARVMPFYYS